MFVIMVLSIVKMIRFRIVIIVVNVIICGRFMILERMKVLLVILSRKFFVVVMMFVVWNIRKMRKNDIMVMMVRVMVLRNESFMVD